MLSGVLSKMLITSGEKTLEKNLDDTHARPVPNISARIENCMRPKASPLMYQSWEHLLFLHWEVPSSSVSSLLPPGLKLDLFEGKAWIGIVPFFMKNVRPRFLPALPGLSNFMELNVRTYVYDELGVPGVWFFSLDANQSLACTLGRNLFKLAYCDAEIKASYNDWIDVRARRRGHSGSAHYRYQIDGPASISEPGTLEFFLLERYVLFCFCQKKGLLKRGRVHHAPYHYHRANLKEYSTMPLIWNGQQNILEAPHHVCASRSVAVSIFGLECIKNQTRLN